MSIEKSEIKILTAQEIGVRLDDLVEAATKEEATLSGAKQALTTAAMKVEELQKHVEKDLDEGKIDLEQQKLIKPWIDRAAGVIRNLATQAEVNQLQARGKIMAFKQSVAEVKRVQDVEKAKVEAAKAPPDTLIEGQPAKRAPGQHPGDPLAKRRRRPNLRAVPAEAPAPGSTDGIAPASTSEPPIGA